MLSVSIAKTGARRESYYSGQITGSAGRSLIQNMNTFCDCFFGAEIGEWGTSKTVMPSLKFLNRSLLRLALDFNGNMDDGTDGLGYFFKSQSSWSE